MKKLLLKLLSNEAYYKAIVHLPGAPILISVIMLASCTKTSLTEKTSVEIGNDFIKAKTTRTASKILEYNQLVIKNATEVFASARGGNKPPKPCHGKNCPTTPPPPPPPTNPPPPDTTGYAVIYADLDGEDLTNDNYWNGQITYAAPVTEYVDWAEVKRIFDVNYAAYRIRLTYDINEYNAADPLRRGVIIVTPSSFLSGSAGVAYVDALFYGINPATGKNTPGFVFSNICFNDAWVIGEIFSHEAAHLIGMSHAKTFVSTTDCTVLAAYAPGVITGNPTTQARSTDAIWGDAHPCRYNGSAYNISDHQILTANLGLK